MTEEEKLLHEQDLADRFEKTIRRYDEEFGENATYDDIMGMAREMHYMMAQLPNEPVRTPYFKELFDEAKRFLLERDLESS